MASDIDRYVPSDAMQELETGLDHLPMAVIDEQVRAVDGEIKAKERSLTVAEQQAVEFKERITVMQEHLQNVQQELVHTQQLLDSKQVRILAHFSPGMHAPCLHDTAYRSA